MRQEHERCLCNPLFTVPIVGWLNNFLQQKEVYEMTASKYTFRFDSLCSAIGFVINVSVGEYMLSDKLRLHIYGNHS